LNITATNNAIAKGKLIDLHPYLKEGNEAASNTYAFIRSYENEHLLVLTNFNSENTIDISIQLPTSLDNVLDGKAFTLEKLLGESLSIDNQAIKTGEPISVSLPPLVGNIYKMNIVE
jgi:hypothetical protein